MNPPDLAKLATEVIRAARAAGNAILQVYESGEFGTEAKDDDSPLTLADKASEKILQAVLPQLLEDTPILSEESEQADYAERKEWTRCWIVDPLDGTKEFLKRNGEFCVGIALVESGVPILGVVHVPVVGTTYYAWKGGGAYKASGEYTQGQNLPQRSSIYLSKSGLRVGISRSHLRPSTIAYIDKLDAPTTIAMGSMLKFCAIADGQIDLYPRFGPTMEWDVAAAQIIVEEVGGTVINAETGQPLQYNKESLLNPYFIAGVLA